VRTTALILDYGEVLSWPQRPEALEAMAGVLGVPSADFADAYWRGRHEYDCGMSARDYWTRAAAWLGLPPLGEAQLSALIACDVASWTEYRDEMWDFVREFRAGGGRTAFLSNGVPEIMARIRADRPLDDWFDAVVVSCEVGLAKPDPAIYRFTLDRLGAAPADSLFVDDRLVNTQAAETLGIRTLTFARGGTVEDVRRAL
jgi:putative hydrolase of the HAD superfamily